MIMHLSDIYRAFTDQALDVPWASQVELDCHIEGHLKWQANYVSVLGGYGSS